MQNDKKRLDINELFRGEEGLYKFFWFCGAVVVTVISLSLSIHHTITHDTAMEEVCSKLNYHKEQTPMYTLCAKYFESRYTKND